MKGIILLSGGLDSSTLLHYVASKGVELYPLAFKYGQRHSIELSMCDKQVIACQAKGYTVHNLQIVDTSFMRDLLKGSSALIGRDVAVPTMEQVGNEVQPITYVPFRNAIFLTIALSYAEAIGAEEVYYGAQKQDYAGYWDTTMEFVEAINCMASYNKKHQIKIIAPFINLRKSEEIVIGTHLGVDYSRTWTSYEVVDEENLIADSLNPTSSDRIKAFAEVGLPDPQKYDPEPVWEKWIAEAKPVDSLENIEKKILWRI